MARIRKTRNPNDGIAPKESAAIRRARTQTEDHAIRERLTEDGGGLADKGEMFAEYQRLLKAGWKP